MSLGAPYNIVFSENPRTIAASEICQNFLPINNGRKFGPANQVHFSISCGSKGAFLDPKATFLKFKFVNENASGGNSMVIDGSVHYVIEPF